MPYRSIEDPVKLRRVLEATLLLEANLDLPTLLGHIVEEARSMTNARYGALGVLSAGGTSLVEFLTSGLSEEEETAIGPRPTGKGVLGLLIEDPRPLRLAHLGDSPKSAGFPEGHPPMQSFLGVPIKVADRVYGNLYLTDKIGWSEFTSDDEALVGALAVAAGFAVENARLHQRAQGVAIYEERDRMARDLHDTVIQRLFAIGLSLQAVAAAPPGMTINDQLRGAIEDIDDTIRQVRSSIFELGEAGIGRGIRSQVLSLTRDLHSVVGFEVPVVFDGPLDTAVSDEMAEHLLATVREALTNVGRHAGGTEARVVLSYSVASSSVRLEVTDNGQGFTGETAAGPGGGLGLANLRKRAEKLGGTFEVGQPATGGTTLVWQVPVGTE